MRSPFKSNILVVPSTSRTILKFVFIGLWLAIISILISSCAQKIGFQNSTVTPAARGYVKVKRDGNNNYIIKVDITDLAEVKKLEPAKQAYIVWMETGQSYAKNIGKIISSTSMLSNRLTANFETVSTTKPTRVFVTAEEDATTQYPGTMVILTTNGF